MRDSQLYLEPYLGRKESRRRLQFRLCGFLVLFLSEFATAQTKTGALVAGPTIEVHEPDGVVRAHWPLATGVPFPQGSVRDVKQLRVADARGGLPTQARALSHWSDGSVRWALLDWQADLSARQTLQFRVENTPSPVAAQVVKVSDRPDAVEVDTGPLQFTVPKHRFAVLTDVQLDGRSVTSGPLTSFFSIGGKRAEALEPTSVTVTESGPLRVRIEMRGKYASSFEYVIRVDAFANQPYVRVLHSFESHSAEPYTAVSQIGIEVPLKLGDRLAYSAGLEKGKPLTGPLPGSGFALLQEDNEILRVNGGRRNARAAGWTDLRDATHGVAVAARFFWQEYPQSFQLRPSGLTYNLWAPEAAPAKVGMGAAKTHELVLYFHGKTPPPSALLGALTEPLAAHVEAAWTVASGALRNSLAPSPATTPFLHDLDAAYDRCRARADAERWDDSGLVRCDDPKRERPRRGFYGMFNWGDWNFPGYHDTTKGCDAWGNLEYDMTQVLALAYAATGTERFHDGMTASARHFMDVDRIHYSAQRPNWIGMNHPKNPLHFAFEHSGIDLGHTWTEGLLSYYYFTGDERALAAARGIADYLVHRLDAGVLKGNPRQWGWPQIALVATYEATGHEAYRKAAVEYAHRGMAKHPPDQIAQWKIGILGEALAYTHSVTHDAAIGDWLARYAAAVLAYPGTADARRLPAVAYVGKISGKREFARPATQAVGSLNFGNWGKPFTIAGRLGFAILAETAETKTTDPETTERR